MNLFICTISFRHQLISIEQIASWAKANHFQGIELWGAHAKNLAEDPAYDKKWLSKYGLRTTMISDYLPLLTNEQELYPKVQLLSRLARHWGASKIRTFAGGTASALSTAGERETLIKSLSNICDWLSSYGLNLVIEYHPDTYADTLASTLDLFQSVNSPNLRLNFDVLHVWESREDILESLQVLAPYIDHFHLKNISTREHLDVFSPPNVYSASGVRAGMVPLFEGQVDYNNFIRTIFSEKKNLAHVDMSLEWFGNQSKNILKRDRYLIQQIIQQYEDIGIKQNYL